MSNGKANAFGKLGRLITKRKWALIAFWLLLLVIIVPVVITASGYTSLTFNSSTDASSESSKAADIIANHLKGAVSKDPLIIVVSTNNASSIETQKFLDDLVTKIKSDSSITGIENIISIYTILIPLLNQTNEGVYLAYNNGNLTYNLLYAVPTIYSKVWYVTYSTTLNDNLVPALRQTNQGVYALISNANQTCALLYSVPMTYSTVYATAYNQTRDTVLAPGIQQANAGVYVAIENANLTYNMLFSTPSIYLNVWCKTYATTHDVNQANTVANQTTAETLYAADPISYQMYTSRLLEAFHTYWTASFSGSGMASWTPEYRASYVSNQTNQLYISTYLASNATEQAFVTAVTNTFSLDDYLTNNQTATNAKLVGFGIQTVVAASAGQSSVEFVTAAYNLGPNPTNAQINALAEDIIQHPTTYNMGTNFISAFNDVAFNQTQVLLQAADPASYTKYTGPLLSAFDNTWRLSFQNTSLQSLSVFERASLVSNMTNKAFIDNALVSDPTSQAFATALIQNFTLTDFLVNTQAQNNAKILNFSIKYLADQGGTSTQLVWAAYNLGASPSNSALTDLANKIIWYPSSYGMTQDFISDFNKVSYDQTKTILKDADKDSFENYTSHLLDNFNSEWATRVPNTPGSSWINETAAAASSVANAKFINDYFSDNADLANAVCTTFSLQDYLNANTTKSNAKLYDFAISYVANESGMSKDLIAAVYNLGENATQSSLQTLASNILWDPDAYNIGEALNTALTSFISSKQDVTLISISFNETSVDNVAAIRNDVASLLKEGNCAVSSVKVTGEEAISQDYMNSTNSDLDVILPITIALLLIATGLFFRSIVTPIITLGTIGIGLGVSMVFPYLIGTFINKVDYTTITVLLTVLIGVGTDYSIFVIARHREERINGLPLQEAINKSITWAGESIVSSGTTVIISFLALATTSMVMLQTMGLIVGLGVIVTLLASLTVPPALTAILGDRIFWPNSGERFERYSKAILAKNHRKGGYFARSGNFSVKHSKAIILLAILLTVPAFYVYATTTQTFDIIGSASDSLESISGMNTLTDAFGGGRMLPSYVVVTFSTPILYSNGSFNQNAMMTLNGISSYIASHEGVGKVTGPTMPFGSTVDYQTITNNSDPATYSSMTSAIGNDNSSALITVQFKDDPYTTVAMDCVKDIRAHLHTHYDSAADVAGIYVGGTTGSILDMRNNFNNEFNSILPVVALGVGIVLFFVLGSLILPVFAILSVLMSIAWTLAATILLFQSAFSYGLLFITPLILFVLLLGLGMDYNIFILTRIREEAAKRQKQNDAIVHAMQQTGGIITAAAIILAGSLGALMLSNNLMLREMGFAFAFSILIDALIVRTYLVPAVMAAFGKWNWYNPIKRLRRVKDEALKDNEKED